MSITKNSSAGNTQIHYNSLSIQNPKNSGPKSTHLKKPSLDAVGLGRHNH